jgi:hypothetical protein
MITFHKKHVQMFAAIEIYEVSITFSECTEPYYFYVVAAFLAFLTDAFTAAATTALLLLLLFGIHFISSVSPANVLLFFAACIIKSVP